MSVESNIGVLINSRKRRGTGVEVLRAELAADSLSDAAKQILHGLLQEHQLPTDEGSFPRSQSSMEGPINHKTRKPIDTNMSDERILQLAQEGELSFLASLLRIIEEESGTVTTKFLIKACCLSVEPGKVPAYCDAKEMVMAALHFLSQSFHGDNTYYPTLPLIEPVSKSADIEKRAYCKVGEWKLEDIIQQVLNLEDIFYESCDSYKWIAREHCVPKLTSGRNLLLLKGSPPSFCMPKTRKASAAAPRRKASAKALSSTGTDHSMTALEDVEHTPAGRQEPLSPDSPVDVSIAAPSSAANVETTLSASDMPSSQQEMESSSVAATTTVQEHERSHDDDVAGDGTDDDGELDTFLPAAK